MWRNVLLDKSSLIAVALGVALICLWYARLSHLDSVTEFEPAAPGINTTKILYAPAVKWSHRYVVDSKIWAEEGLAVGPPPPPPPSAARRRGPSELRARESRGFTSDFTALFEIPDGIGTGAQKKCRGIVWLFHGCSHSATNFWMKSARCPRCEGLPEDVRLADKLLESNYVIAAISSVERKEKCWSGDDAYRAAAAYLSLLKSPEIKRLQSGQKHVVLPVFGIGSSSGGHFLEFISSLPAKDSLLTNYRATPFAAVSQIVSGSSDPRENPPTLYVHMTQDSYTASGVARGLKKFSKNGVPAREAHLKPIPITSYFFSSRVPLISSDASLMLFEAMVRANLTNSNGFLKSDPRYNQKVLKNVLQPVARGVASDLLTPDASPILQELNVAYGKHEMSADKADDITQWFDAFGCLWSAVSIAYNSSSDHFGRLAIHTRYIHELKRPDGVQKSELCPQLRHSL